MTEVPPEFQQGTIVPLEEVTRCCKSCGIDVRVFRGCRVIHPERLELGDHVQIDEQVFILAGNGVSVGNYVHFAVGCSITGGGSCRIGNFVGLGAGVRIVTGTELVDEGGLSNPTVPAELRRVRRGFVSIQDHAIVFTNSIVLPDVTIGEGAVVAAGSLVHHDLKPWSIHAGNPLVQVGVRDREKVMESARSALR